eukprot:1134963-Prymnesium_polylepis.1
MLCCCELCNRRCTVRSADVGCAGNIFISFHVRRPGFPGRGRSPPASLANAVAAGVFSTGRVRAVEPTNNASEECLRIIGSVTIPQVHVAAALLCYLGVLEDKVADSATETSTAAFLRGAVTAHVG